MQVRHDWDAHAISARGVVGVLCPIRIPDSLQLTGNNGGAKMSPEWRMANTSA